MRGISYLAALLTALVFVAGADKGKTKVDFLDQALFRFGMEQSTAIDRLGKDPDDWNVLYQVDTPQTAEFACTYKDSELYLVRFYQGQCYFLERRGELSLEDVQRVFDYFAGLYGTTPEATQSRDARLLYARWMLKDRDIELTAHLRDGVSYIMTYQEFDPLLLGEALHVREQELQNGESLEIDPLTGKPRLATHDQTAGSETETSSEEGADGEDETADEPEQDPPPEEPEDDDWY